MCNENLELYLCPLTCRAKIGSRCIHKFLITSCFVKLRMGRVRAKKTKEEDERGGGYG